MSGLGRRRLLSSSAIVPVAMVIKFDPIPPEPSPYEEFQRRLLRQIADSLSLSYDELTAQWRQPRSIWFEGGGHGKSRLVSHVQAIVDPVKDRG